ncbi:Hsp70 family protein [Nocardia sp. NPDC052254]|uniref:Hsp70 family protein n=1 Tax=Nocardia sp. NPDC052254 TaxID=3155681 RepID=UPI003443A33E
MSIGSVNSVWAATAGDRDRPAVRVRRTAVSVDPAGAVRVGGTPRFAPVVTDFADLTKVREPVSLGGRIWSAADLVAAVAGCLVGATDPESGPVLTHPACYTSRQVAALQFALHRAGMFDVILMPEPVAAAEWLDAEFGVSATGSTLVYDLGANTVDVAVVRTESEWDQRGTVGPGVRSDSYGGRPLGSMLARYARALAPDMPVPVSKVVPAEDTRRLRAWHVRTSLRVVRECLRGARIGIEDIDRVLLVGGAARPAEVAEVLAELGPPVVVAPDPAHTVATGAAIASARFAGGTGNTGRYTRVAAVASSAAVVSALAMSAATMIGGGPVGTDGPIMEFGPVLAGPAQALREEIDGPRLPGLGAGFATLADRADGLIASAVPALRTYSGAAQGFSKALTGQSENTLRVFGPATPCEPPRGGTYADPARFTNPLPFGSSGAAAALAARTLPGTWLPGRDQGSTKPPDGPPAPGGDTPPAPDPAPAPIGDPVASGPASGSGTGESSSAPQASSPGANSTSGNSGTAGSGTSEDNNGGSAVHPGASDSAGSGSESQPVSANSSATSPVPGTSASNTNDSGTDSSGGATNSGDAASQDSGTHSGPAASSPDDAGSAADTANSGGGANSSGATHSSGENSHTGTTPSGPSAGADSDAGAGAAPGAGMNSTPGSGAGVGTRPGGTGSVPAVPAVPAAPAPVRPGVVSPPRPGGLGTGVAPGGGFHGGGMGSMPGGFHGGGFGGFHH